MNAIQIFSYKEQQVRTTEIDSEVWFVAKDVCDILGIVNAIAFPQNMNKELK